MALEGNFDSGQPLPTDKASLGATEIRITRQALVDAFIGEHETSGASSASPNFPQREGSARVYVQETEPAFDGADNTAKAEIADREGRIWVKKSTREVMVYEEDTPGWFSSNTALIARASNDYGGYIGNGGTEIIVSRDRSIPVEIDLLRINDVELKSDVPYLHIVNLTLYAPVSGGYPLSFGLYWKNEDLADGDTPFVDKSILFQNSVYMDGILLTLIQPVVKAGATETKDIRVGLHLDWTADLGFDIPLYIVKMASHLLFRLAQ